MMRAGLYGLFCIALLSACGAPHPTGSPQDVASVRLFNSGLGDLTFHMPLFPGDTLRVEVRMYAANGSQIMSVTGGAELAFTFSPPTLASSTPVNGETLVRDVTTSALQGTSGTLEVALHFPADASTKTFGPFDVLVH